MNLSQTAFAFGCQFSAVAVSTSRCCRNRSVTRFLNCVVAVTTIQLQLSSVKFVTERNRLFWLVPNVNDRWMDRRKQTRCQVATDCDSAYGCQQSELVNPSREMKLLHSNHQVRPVRSLVKCRSWMKNGGTDRTKIGTPETEILSIHR